MSTSPTSGVPSEALGISAKLASHNGRWLPDDMELYGALKTPDDLVQSEGAPETESALLVQAQEAREVSEHSVHAWGGRRAAGQVRAAEAAPPAASATPAKRGGAPSAAAMWASRGPRTLDLVLLAEKQSKATQQQLRTPDDLVVPGQPEDGPDGADALRAEQLFVQQMSAEPSREHSVHAWHTGPPALQPEPQ